MKFSAFFRTALFSCFYILASFSVMSFVSATVFAQSTPQERAAMEQKRASVELEARAYVETLFARLCPGRCELVDLKATIASPQAVGAVTPGFDMASAPAYDVSAQQIDVTILLDNKLPRNFLSNIPRMLQYRMSGLAPVINIRPEVLDFPEPQAHPMPTYPLEPPQPQPEPRATPEPTEPAAPPVEQEPLAESPAEEPSLWQNWQALLPWIALLLTLLILSLLIVHILKRLEKLSEARESELSPTPQPEPVVSESESMPDIDELTQKLRKSRALQNRVMRQWVLDDTSEVAIFVRLVGPEIIADLKSDTALRANLEEVSNHIAGQSGPMSPEQARNVVNSAWSRLTATRVLYDEHGLTANWDFLEGLTLSTLHRLMENCIASEKAYVIGQLSPALRASFLNSLSPSVRRDLLFNTTNAQLLTKQEAMTLASRLRKIADELSHIGPEAEGQASLVTDMLATMALDEQMEMLRELDQKRPDVTQAVLNRVCLEPTYLVVPQDILANALHRMPVATLANFVRGTHASISQHIIENAPRMTRDTLLTELFLELPVDKKTGKLKSNFAFDLADIPVERADYLAARQSFSDLVIQSLKRNGHDLIQLNRHALSQPVLTNSPAPSQETVA